MARRESSRPFHRAQGIAQERRDVLLGAGERGRIAAHGRAALHAAPEVGGDRSGIAQRLAGIEAAHGAAVDLDFRLAVTGALQVLEEARRLRNVEIVVRAVVGDHLDRHTFGRKPGRIVAAGRRRRVVVGAAQQHQDRRAAHLLGAIGDAAGRVEGHVRGKAEVTAEYTASQRLQAGVEGNLAAA